MSKFQVLSDPQVLMTKSRSVGILNSAHKFAGPNLKRVVLLGSAVSVLDSFQDMSVAGKNYTEKDWNPVRRCSTV
jgi:hypothetical protein